MGDEARHNDGMQGRTRRFLDYLKTERRYSLLTVDAYRRDLSEFAAYMRETFGNEDWDAVDRMCLRSYVAHLVDEGRAPYTIRRKISALRSFFHYEMRAGRLSVNPALRLPLPKAGKRLVYFVEESGMERLNRDEAAGVAAGVGHAGLVGSPVVIGGIRVGPPGIVVIVSVGATRKKRDGNRNPKVRSKPIATT